MNINAFVKINTEDLVDSMIETLTESQLRSFVNQLCDKIQLLEFDEALLADRLRAVMPFYNDNSSEGYEEPLDINNIIRDYPEI